MKNANDYADMIIRDEQQKFVSERSTIHQPERIERLYEFEDGAVVKYEWQGFGPWMVESFNHRFTLIRLPNDAGDLQLGVIRSIDYPPGFIR